MSKRGWGLLRAGLLILVVMALSPVDPLVLVFVPLAVLLLAFRHRDPLALGVAALLLLLTFQGFGDVTGPLWYVERAWALLLGGGFVAAVVLGHRGGALRPGLLAVGGGFGVVLLSTVVRPGLVAELDWWMGRELGRMAGLAREWLQAIGGGQGWGPELQAAMDRALTWQVFLYPALLALASLSALALARYILLRFQGRESGLGPVREFRFGDELVWIFIAGLLLFLLPVGEVAQRIGENAMVFMGGLYFLRGIGVLLWIGAASVTSTWWAFLWGLAAVVLYPLAVGTALVLGLGDTWLHVRERMARLKSDGS